MSNEERTEKRKILGNAISNSRLEQDYKYTRGEAVAAVTSFLYRLYDYYDIYNEKTISGLDLALLLANIC